LKKLHTETSTSVDMEVTAAYSRKINLERGIKWTQSKMCLRLG